MLFLFHGLDWHGWWGELGHLGHEPWGSSTSHTASRSSSSRWPSSPWRHSSPWCCSKGISICWGLISSAWHRSSIPLKLTDKLGDCLLIRTIEQRLLLLLLLSQRLRNPSHECLIIGRFWVLKFLKNGLFHPIWQLDNQSDHVWPLGNSCATGAALLRLLALLLVMVLNHFIEVS